MYTRFICCCNLILSTIIVLELVAKFLNKVVTQFNLPFFYHMYIWLFVNLLRWFVYWWVGVVGDYWRIWVVRVVWHDFRAFVTICEVITASIMVVIVISVAGLVMVFVVFVYDDAANLISIIAWWKLRSEIIEKVRRGFKIVISSPAIEVSEKVILLKITFYFLRKITYRNTPEASPFLNIPYKFQVHITHITCFIQQKSKMCF